jgi:ribosomal protein S18 acetylase RimI-like enzyme
MRETLLDNPAWYALTDRQAWQGERNGNAARYLPAISPIGALREPSAAGLDALAALCGRDLVMVLSAVPELPSTPRFRVARTVPVRQMVCEGTPVTVELTADRLGNDDAADMVALVKLTEPGPFAERTVELGSYYGVRNEAGRLVAMAGERLKPRGWTEISGVCTHPDGRGRGYAQALVARLTAAALARGEGAFLYVAVGSPSQHVATRLYERVGYRFRREMYVHALLPA